LSQASEGWQYIEQNFIEERCLYIQNNTILFTIMGIKEIYRIDQVPGTGANNVMVLDKVTYTKVSDARANLQF
jgi:hypothetical protein